MTKIYSKNLIKFLTVGLAIGLLGGCKKQDRPEIDTDVQAAQDNAQAEYIFTDVNNIVDDAARSQGGVNKKYSSLLDACVDIKQDSTLTDSINNYFPRKLTCSWDSCVAGTGDVRMGKMIIEFTAPFTKKDAVIKTSFQNFSLNGYSVKGTRTMTNRGDDASTKLPVYGIDIDGSVVSSSGKEIVLKSAQTKKILSDKGTPSPLDDAYQITGSSSGVSGGLAFDALITTPLVVDRTVCKFISNGVLEITPKGKTVRKVDFGKCDDVATVEIAGTTYTIHLPGK